jgi:hypothetical protein
MAGGDFIGAAIVHDALKKGVPYFPRAGLHRTPVPPAVRQRVARLDHGGYSGGFSQTGHKTGVLIRIRASEQMIHVSDKNFDIPQTPKMQKQMEQRGRVRPPGNRENNTVTRAEHLMLPYGRFDPVFEGRGHGRIRETQAPEGTKMAFPI